MSTNFKSAAFPFASTVTGVLGPKSDRDIVFTSIRNIILTPKGRQPYDPTIGSQIPLLVFEPNDAVTRSLIRFYAKEDIERQEPRVRVVSVLVEQRGNHNIGVTIGFVLANDPNQQVHIAPVEFDIG